VSEAVPVTDNQAASRFEIRDGGYVAELLYRRNGNRLVLIHTEVPVELEGRGMAGRLVAEAVARAAREGLTIVPFCPFARGWLERHADVADRVAIDWPAV
jgi:predicted GNAT family acetyltransferase